MPGKKWLLAAAVFLGTAVAFFIVGNLCWYGMAIGVLPKNSDVVFAAMVGGGICGGIGFFVLGIAFLRLRSFF